MPLTERAAGFSTGLPYCGAAPSPAELLSRWNLDPVLLVALAIAPFLVRTMIRDGRVGKAGFTGAWLVAFILFVSPLCAATSALFSVRAIHHLALTTLLAPLIAYALPKVTLGVGSLASWALLHAITFWAWHAPGLYSAALSNDLLYWIMQVSLLGSAVGLWLAVRRSEVVAAVAALLGTMVQMGLLGALLTFSGTPLYLPHLASTAAWGLTPLQDQQLAGLIMWAPGAGLYLAAAAWILARWLHRAEQPVAA